MDSGQIAEALILDEWVEAAKVSKVSSLNGLSSRHGSIIDEGQMAIYYILD